MIEVPSAKPTSSADRSVFGAAAAATIRFRWAVIVAWAGLLVFGGAFAPRLSEVFERESMAKTVGEAQAANDLIAAKFPHRSAYEQLLVLTSDTRTVDDQEYRQAANRAIAAVYGSGVVKNVTSYYDSGDGQLVSADARTTYALVDLRSRTHADGMTAAGKVLDAVKDARLSGDVRAYVTGLEASHADLIVSARQSMSRAEKVGLPVAMVILLLVFGALVAAGLPLIVGLISIVIALALAFVVGQWVDMNIMMENFVLMIGLGVGIDYSLFLLSRYRAERVTGRPVTEAIVASVSHAGRAIAFSGTAVAVGLSALLVTGDQAIRSMGVGTILVVVVAVAASLTLLPAVLALLGDRIESPRWLSGVIARTRRGGFLHRWATHVMRHPVLFGALGVVIMGALAYPALSMKTGSIGMNMLPRDAQSRRGFDVASAAFGPGIMSPVQIVIQSDAGIDQPDTVDGIYRLTKAIEGDARFSGATSIASLAPSDSASDLRALFANRFTQLSPDLAQRASDLVNLHDGADTTIVLARLNGETGSDSSRQAVRALRTQLIPSIPELRHTRVLVGGSTAQEMDSVDALYARFPVVVALILGLTFVLLFVLFRSVLIPLKAVLMNLLSVFASYGALTLVFQRGIGDELLGFHANGAITDVTPVLLFAILFGLSMDYEVFLLSRIRELHDRGFSNEEAVSLGLEQTGGVITGAAAIMVAVFAAFVLSPIVALKELGFALAAATLIDATVVRMLLVPATMRLLGDWNWWLPSFLARLLPKVALEP